MPQVIRSPRSNRICLTSVGAVITSGLLFIAAIPWSGSASPLSFSSEIIFTLTFGLSALAFAFFVAWHLSIRAELSETEIVRRSLLGTKSLPLDQIDSALFTSYRGCVFLTLRASKHWISFSTYTFSMAQLDQIQAFLVREAAKSSRTVQTSLPPLTTKQAVYFTVYYLLAIVAVFVVIAIAGIHNNQRRRHVAVSLPPASLTLNPSSSVSSNHR